MTIATAPAIISDFTVTIPAINANDTFVFLNLANNFTAIQTFDVGSLHRDNDRAWFGDASDAAIWYDGTNLVINSLLVGSGYIDASSSDIAVNHLGLVGTAPISTNAIVATVTSSTLVRVLNFSLTYQGTGASVVIVATGTWDNGSNNVNIGGGTATIRNSTFTTTSTAVHGWKGSIGISDTPAASAGTHKYNGFWTNWLGAGGTHTGGTFIRRGFYQEAFTALSGVGSDLIWGVLVNNDIQINTGGKILLEGTDTTKGDSYFIYESTSIAMYADAVNALSLTSSETVVKTGLKLPRNAQAGNYTTLMTDMYIGITSTAAARTVTLIAAATAGAGKVYVVKDESGGAATNNITVDANASELVDGALTKVINTNYGSITIICDGSNWFTI